MADKDNPQLFPDKMGNRAYSLAALQDRIEDAFAEETSGRVDILGELDTREKRITAVTEVADYVLATEYVRLPADSRQTLIANAVANLFYFGALDQFLRDEAITEVTIENIKRVGVRRGAGEMQSVDSPFYDLAHLERTLNRVIAPANTTLTQDYPFIEIGLQLHDRPARVSIIAPPISPLYSVQIRLHPAEPLALKDLVPDVIPESAASLLAEIMNSKKGIIITGEVGVGKTTVLAALLRAHAKIDDTLVIERAAEMHLPADMRRVASQPPKPGDVASAIEFEARIVDALGDLPTTVALDEIRGDESDPLWQLLNHATQPMIAFRGTSHPQRLLSALSMALRKKQWGLESEAIHQTLWEKLPFVLALHKFPGQNPRLASLAQWIKEGDSLSLQPLVTWGADGDPLRSEAMPRLR